jgi:enoyl-CoA hydratase/carnithine racemase
VESSDGVATLTLNRPDKLNAISYEMMMEVQAALDELATRPDIACLVLAGSGRSFSAGFDLESLANALDKLRSMASTIDALEAFPRPTFAKIHGHCLTGGLELALACDVLVASDDATFADTHSRWGIVPVCGLSVRLPERIGPARAKLLGFSGRRIDAATAEAWGLVDLRVPVDELDLAVSDLAAESGANSADANRILKELIHTSAASDMTRDDKLASERELRLGVPADRAERLSAG